MGKINSYIKGWEKKGYPNGIPDECPSELEKLNIVPSYRKICIAIIKNVHNLEDLGFKREKSKVYSELKRIEINERTKKNIGKQLNLF
jgi:predicted phosphoadenosine phosphosulfate sulfurtransferase